VKIDESAMTGESDPQRKSSFDQITASNANMTSTLSQKKSNPFLVSGTKVVDGTGIMLVLTVGEHTQQGRLKLLTENESSPTPLQ
jgi:magnesium-transporting ATPase (P-type)